MTRYHWPAFVFVATYAAVIVGSMVWLKESRPARGVSDPDGQLMRLIEREAFNLYRQRSDGRIVCN